MFSAFVVIVFSFNVVPAAAIRGTTHLSLSKLDAEEQSIGFPVSDPDCDIDLSLTSHNESIDDIDWDAADCIKKSDSGNSGGVYFVQTATRVLVIKPMFTAGSLVSFTYSPVRTPLFRLISPDDEEWSQMKAAIRKTKAFATNKALVEMMNEARAGQGVALMQVVATNPAFPTVNRLITPDAYCASMHASEGGCFCGPPEDKCQKCFGDVKAYLEPKLPEELKMSNLLKTAYVEDTCKLTIYDNFLMDWDQEPTFERRGPFTSNGDNVMLDSAGHIVNIDSSFNHDYALFKDKDGDKDVYMGVQNQKGSIRAPDHWLAPLVEFFAGKATNSTWYTRVKGQMLTMLIMPSWMDAPNRAAEKKIKDQCGIEQSALYQHMKVPHDGAPDAEELWSRCETAFESEVKRLAALDFDTISAALDHFHEGCRALMGGETTCFHKVDFLSFLKEHQTALKTMMEPKIVAH